MQDKRFYPYLFLHAGIVTLWVAVVFRYAGFRKYKKIEPVCFRTGGNYQRNSQSDDIRPKTPLYY